MRREGEAHLLAPQNLETLWACSHLKQIKMEIKQGQKLSKIVLFKSFRNSKRRNNGNFTSKSNSNKIKLCGGQHYLF